MVKKLFKILPIISWATDYKGREIMVYLYCLTHNAVQYVVLVDHTTGRMWLHSRWFRWDSSECCLEDSISIMGRGWSLWPWSRGGWWQTWLQMRCTEGSWLQRRPDYWNAQKKCTLPRRCTEDSDGYRGERRVQRRQMAELIKVHKLMRGIVNIDNRKLPPIAGANKTMI